VILDDEDGPQGLVSRASEALAELLHGHEDALDEGLRVTLERVLSALDVVDAELTRATVALHLGEDAAWEDEELEHDA
jgi:BMFP domain-containing protein YqiC